MLNLLVHQVRLITSTETHWIITSARTNTDISSLNSQLNRFLICNGNRDSDSLRAYDPCFISLRKHGNFSSSNTFLIGPGAHPDLSNAYHGSVLDLKQPGFGVHHTYSSGAEVRTE